MGFLFLISFPLNLQKRLNSLRYFSSAIFVIVVGTISVSVVQSPFYYNVYKNNPDYKIDIWTAKPNITSIQSLSTLVFIYNCQGSFFYARGEMISKTKKRIRQVIKNLIWIECVIYFAIGVGGYLSLGSKMVPQIYTLRRKLSKFSLNR